MEPRLALPRELAARVDAPPELAPENPPPPDDERVEAPALLPRDPASRVPALARPPESPPPARPCA